MGVCPPTGRIRGWPPRLCCHRPEGLSAVTSCARGLGFVVEVSPDEGRSRPPGVLRPHMVWLSQGVGRGGAGGASKSLGYSLLLLIIFSIPKSRCSQVSLLFFLPSLNLVVKVCLADLYVLQVIKLPFLL